MRDIRFFDNFQTAMIDNHTFTPLTRKYSEISFTTYSVLWV